MSRCQHSELITKFCLSETCTWREPAGCDTCFRKYHSHPTDLDIITLDKLEKINATLAVKADIKVKVRPLQEAIYNYFMIMKSQLSSSIDAVSRVMSNRLSYPYLSEQEQLAVHKKIKNREFKKINKKELKSYYQFAEALDPETLQSREKSLYFEEVASTAQTFQKINAAFKAYQDSVSRLDTSFSIEKSFYEKILEISNTIKELEKQPSSNDPSSTKGSYSKPENNSNMLKIPEEKKTTKDRRVSFDVGVAQQQQMHERYRSPVSYDQNEKQIMEKKKKLLDMLNANASKKSQVDGLTVNFETKKEEAPKKDDRKDILSIKQVREETTSQQKSNLPRSVDKTLSSYDSKGRPKPKDLVIQGSIRKQIEFGSAKSEEDNKSSKADSQVFSGNIFSELIDKGLKIPQMIAHTALPEGQNKQKLYEDSKDVKEQKITIEVKKFEETEEASSPLLKKRKTKKAGNFQLFKIQSNREGELDKITEEESPVKKDKMEEKEQEMLLKDKEADSLALLVESLRMPAEKAIPFLEAAVKYANNNLSATEYLSYLYLEVGKPKKCLDLCNDMLQRLEDSPEAGKLSAHISNNKAAALNMLGRYSESISILEKCLEHSNKDIYFKNLGDAYFSIGILEKAAFNYEKAVSLNSELDEAYYNLAVCLYTQGHFNQSKLNVQKALRINRQNVEYDQLHKEVSKKVAA